MNPYLINVLPLTPVVLERLITRIASAKLDVPTHPGRFSVREVVAHLAEWEPILLERMQSALYCSGSNVSGRDEAEMAVVSEYRETEISERLLTFREARALTLRFLEGVEEGDWQKYVIHSERGTQTLYDQANLLIGHDLYHIEQVTTVL